MMCIHGIPDLEEIWEAAGIWMIALGDRLYHFHTYDLGICQ